MRALRVSLVGTVIVALLGGLGAVALAQMDADPEAVYFTATGQISGGVDGMVSAGDVWSWRDGTLNIEVEASDPRASGTLSNFANADFDTEADQGIEWGTLRIENADGTWVGPYAGMGYTPPEDEFSSSMLAGMLVGDGDYAGYTMSLWLDTFGRATVSKLHGVIFKGQPPAVEVITDPIEVVAAKQDAVAGYLVVPTVLALSAAEVSPDAFTDLREVRGRKAAVDIPAGTPITPDLLDPAE